ncbi:MAG: aminomethyl-transferring glycine dehydrogenase subunit GcvPA [Halofilum sp. (in: g-proteobacteria)]|nr:aminomethyl-transferring glycine dehydrogenase subunit GcvPA [Halofilum sp. (in: g-proteobacteria)]
MPFIPHTETDVRSMLDAIGVEDIDGLFDEIAGGLRAGELEGVPEGMPEMAVNRLMERRAAQEGRPLCFLGAGAYPHHIPQAIWQLTTRGEFYSAYTPYQAEASQGTLQVTYEFQSMMAELTGMEVSNASLYDGGSALAEAILMAVRGNRKAKSKRVIVPRAVHPHYRDATRTIVRNQGIELVEADFDRSTGTTPLEQLDAALGDEAVAAVVIPQPNFFGRLEDVDALTDRAHECGAQVIAVANPTALALLSPPGQWGAKGVDIVVGEGQPLGIPLSAGGPYVGFLCTRKNLARQMPGRVVGRTVDAEGNTGYVMTLRAREQDIRRSKATSNICTNQGLMVTAATLYMSIMGPEGFERVARHCHANARALRDELCAIDGVSAAFDGPFFHEFVLRIDGRPVTDVLGDLAGEDILGGLALEPYYDDLGDAMLVCATELHGEDERRAFAEALARAVA